MKKALVTYIILLGGLFFTSCLKPNGVHISMRLFLKATTGIKKDIGTAD